MRKVLRDTALQNLFERDGFVIVPFLEKEHVAQLLSFYDSLEHEKTFGFHCTIHSQRVDYRRKVSDGINQLFNKLAHQYLEKYKPIFSNFTVKEARPDSEFDIHLDWTMVDENRYSSVTIWSPLHDITESNSYLWVLKGSHKFGFTIRGGPGLRLQTAQPLPLTEEDKFDRLIVKLKAGTALIYDHRVFHGSPPNISSQRRIAINYTMIPEETQSWHYHFLQDDLVEIFEVDPDFYIRHIIGTIPVGVRSLGTIAVEPNFLDQEQVNSIFKLPRYT